MKYVWGILVFLFIAFLLAQGLQAAISPEDEQLVKDSNNPLANMISFPLQFNYDYGAGPDGDGSRMTLNIQPIIPIPISDKLITLSRTILPVEYADRKAVGSSKFGLGDMVESIYVGPMHSKVIWGIGPAFMLPTATEDIFSLGKDKWSAGPAAIVAYQTNGWTFATVTYQVWSFAGPDSSDNVNFLFFQPIIMKSVGMVSVGVNSEMQFDWQHDENIIPLNLMVNKLVKFGKLPCTLGAGFRYYLDKPDEYSKWGFRLVSTFMFPE